MLIMVSAALAVILSIGVIPVVASSMRLCEIVMSDSPIRPGSTWQEVDFSWYVHFRCFSRTNKSTNIPITGAGRGFQYGLKSKLTSVYLPRLFHPFLLYLSKFSTAPTEPPHLLKYPPYQGTGGVGGRRTWSASTMTTSRRERVALLTLMGRED